jgi:hypothetical protein
MSASFLCSAAVRASETEKFERGAGVVYQQEGSQRLGLCSMNLDLALSEPRISNLHLVVAAVVGLRLEQVGHREWAQHFRVALDHTHRLQRRVRAHFFVDKERNTRLDVADP